MSVYIFVWHWPNWLASDDELQGPIYDKPATPHLCFFDSHHKNFFPPISVSVVVRQIVELSTEGFSLYPSIFLMYGTGTLVASTGNMDELMGGLV